MGTLLLSSAALTSLFIFLFLFFLFLFFSNNILHKMENENNFNVVKEELENIASGLRRLINSDESLNVAVDSQSESRIDATASAASSTSGVGLRRLLKRISREASENRASNASSADNLDWRPLLDSSTESIKNASMRNLDLGRLFEEEIASAVSSTDKLDWRPLLDSVENLNAASLSDFDLKRLFAEGKNAKDATTSVNDLELRRLFEECGKATPESLSNLCINRLFNRNDDSKSLSNLCVDRLFKREESDANAKQEKSLIDLGTRRLFQEEKPAAASLSDLGMAQLFQPSTHDQTTTDQAFSGAEAPDTSSNAWTTDVIVSLRALIEAKLRLLLQSKADTEVDISAPAGIESTTPTVGAPVRRKLVAKRRIVRRKEDLNGKGDNAKEEQKMDAGEKEKSKVDAGDDHNKVESGDPKEAVDEGSEVEERSKNQKEKSKGDEVKVEEQGESGDEEEAGTQEKKESEGEENGMKDQDPTYQDDESSISEEEMEVDDVEEDDGEESDDEEEESEKDNVVSGDDAKGDHVEESEGKDPVQDGKGEKKDGEKGGASVEEEEEGEEEEENEAVEEVENNETNGEECDCDDGYGVIDAGDCVLLDWLRFFIGMFYDEVEEEEVSAEAEKAGPFDWFITLFVMVCSAFICAMSFGPAM